jgi:hypothetical protein
MGHDALRDELLTTVLEGLRSARDFAAMMIAYDELECFSASWQGSPYCWSRSQKLVLSEAKVLRRDALAMRAGGRANGF